MIFAFNKGVDRPVVFKGLRAQYIWWLGAGVLTWLLLFAMMYMAGVEILVCVVIVGCLGVFWFRYVYRMNKRYGEHGMMKKMARQGVPKWVNCDKWFVK